MDAIPQEIQDRAQKVFSKHSRHEIVTWARNLQDHYQLMIAREKPLNLNYAKPFSNTNDLAKNVPEIHASTAAEKSQRETELDNFVKKAESFNEVYADEKSEHKMSQSEHKLHHEKQILQMNYERHHALGYLFRKMPHNYMIYKRIFSEIKSRDPKYVPVSVLDFGSGLGSGVWGAIHSYDTLERCAAVEPNVNMRQLGKYLTKEVEPDILWTDSLSMIPGAGSQRGQFDLVILGFVLSEIPSAHARETILDTVFSRVNDGGYFVIAETGSPKGFRFINDFRNKIIEMSRDEANIVAPCPHHNK